MKFSELVESPVGKKGRTSLKDAIAHISPELEKEFFKLVKAMGGKTVANVLLNNITVAPVGTADSVLKRYQDQNHNQSDKLKKSRQIKESGLEEKAEISDAEGVLISKNIKIKSKFETKFGTEFKLAKKYSEQEIKKVLHDYRVTFDEDSIFVSV